MASKTLNKKLKIGITGGIGSGKSTFCEIVKNYGYPILHADYIAKNIMTTDSGVKSKIISQFGEESYNGNELNRPYLSAKVFTDPEKLQLLNSIVHPVVIEQSAKLMDEQLLQHDVVFYEAALIYEAHMEGLFDYIVLLTADEENRIRRIIEREHVDAEHVRARIKNQIPDEEKKHKADIVISNDGSIEELQNKVKFAISILSAVPT